MEKIDEEYIRRQLEFLKYSELSKYKIIELFEERILKLKNPFLSCYFASAFPDSNIKKHEQVVIDSKDLACCFSFANSVPKADVKMLSKVVVDSEDIEYNKKFLFEVDKCDKVAHINFLAEYNKYFTLIDYLESKRGSRLLPTDAATKRLSELFIETKDPYLNYEIARILKNKVDINKHAEVVMNNEAHVSFGGVNDITYYSYLFALDVPEAPIDKFRQIVLKSGEAEENYLFALNIISTDEEFDAHKDVVFNSGNEKMIKEFNNLIKERYPEEKHKEFIKELTTYIDSYIKEQ